MNMVSVFWLQIKGVIFTRVLLPWLAPTFLTKTEHMGAELRKKQFLVNLFGKCKVMLFY